MSRKKASKNFSSKDFSDTAYEIGKLVEQKQQAYGDSFGRSGACLRQMYPNGITPTQYDDVLTIARILDKLFRIATNVNAFGENPYKDITGYGLLGYKRHQKNQELLNGSHSTRTAAKRKAAKQKRTTRPNRNRQRSQSIKGKVLSKKR